MNIKVIETRVKELQQDKVKLFGLIKELTTIIQHLNACDGDSSREIIGQKAHKLVIRVNGILERMK